MQPKQPPAPPNADGELERWAGLRDFLGAAACQHPIQAGRRLVMPPQQACLPPAACRLLALQHGRLHLAAVRPPKWGVSIATAE
jgi:hypothetical protein